MPSEFASRPIDLQGFLLANSQVPTIRSRKRFRLALFETLVEHIVGTVVPEIDTASRKLPKHLYRIFGVFQISIEHSIDFFAESSLGEFDHLYKLYFHQFCSS